MITYFFQILKLLYCQFKNSKNVVMINLTIIFFIWNGVYSQKKQKIFVKGQVLPFFFHFIFVFVCSPTKQNTVQNCV